MIWQWKKAGIAIAVALLPAAAGHAADAAPLKPGDSAAGKTVFESTCALCHGPNGEGSSLGVPLASDKATAYTNAQLVEKITKGVPDRGMAAFGDLLSAQEIVDVTAYIRTLQPKYDPKKEPAVASGDKGTSTTKPADKPTTGTTATRGVTAAPARGATAPASTPATRPAATPAAGARGAAPAPRSNDRPTTRTASSAGSTAPAGAHVALAMDVAMVGGDATAGEQVFRNTGCIGCHSVFNGGGKVAPDLTRVAASLSKEQLYEAVAMPSKTVAAEYKTKEVVANTGEAFTSPFRNETAETIQFLSKQGSGWNTYMKNELQVLKDSDKSYMPEGILTKLDDKQQKDLFAFLSNLK